MNAGGRIGYLEVGLLGHRELRIGRGRRRWRAGNISGRYRFVIIEVVFFCTLTSFVVDDTGRSAIRRVSVRSDVVLDVDTH